jgi:hypothetical protein
LPIRSGVNQTESFILTSAMDIRRAQKRILFYVLLPGIALYVGMRLWAQFRHVDVYVSREAPMAGGKRNAREKIGHFREWTEWTLWTAWTDN